MAYMRQLSAELDQADTKPAKPQCFICDAAQIQPKTPDATERLVIDVDEHTVIMLNRYPYTNGHLMVCPKKHVSSLSDLNAIERASLMEATEKTERLLKAALNCQGFNVGMNLGRCAGAGMPGHIHVHVLPRWEGDTNFMQTIGQVRVIPQALEESYAWLLNFYQKITEAGA